MALVNEQEAKDRCAQLAAEHPDRASNNWLPVKQKDDTWSVARIPLPPPVDGGAENRDDSRPVADDPRAENPWINPPPWIGGI